MDKLIVEIDKDLKIWLKMYAVKENETIKDIITGLIQRLKEEVGK